MTSPPGPACCSPFFARDREGRAVRLLLGSASLSPQTPAGTVNVAFEGCGHKQVLGHVKYSPLTLLVSSAPKSAGSRACSPLRGIHVPTPAGAAASLSQHRRGFYQIHSGLGKLHNVLKVPFFFFNLFLT